jgi:hypothetical protein
MKWLTPARVGAAATFAFFATLAAACDHAVAPLSDPDSDPEAKAQFSPPGTGATSGPWSKCTYSQEEGSLGAEGIPDICPDPAGKGCGGFSSMIVDLDDGNRVCVLANFCYYTCDHDADCPAPESGSSTPVCRGQCYLPCTATSQCPDGMLCYDDGGIENGVAAHCQWTFPCPDSIK